MLRNEATIAVQSSFSREVPQQAAEIINTDVTAEKQEGLAREEENNRDVEMREVESKIIDLPLPNHLNHLMKLFEQFEANFRLHRNRHDAWTASMDLMISMIESSLNRTFNEGHLRQFLTIVPGFYLHKWEMVRGRLILLIELPADAAHQMEDERLALIPKSVNDTN